MITIYDLKTREKHTGRLVLPSYVDNLRDEIERFVEHIGRCELVNAREDLEEIRSSKYLQSNINTTNIR